MILQRQPNAWSCILCAVAMALDEGWRKLIGEIGHDGSEIVLPTLPDPARRRGFHLQELIPLALKRGFAVTPLEALPYSTPDGKSEFPVDFKIKPEKRFQLYMVHSRGILTGLAHQWRHAVAWNGEKIYDSRGLIYPFLDCKIDIDTYWRFDRIE